MPPEPRSTQPRQFLVEVYGPLFAALGRLTLPSPVRLSDFINEREGFLRLNDVEFITDGDLGVTAPGSPQTPYLINKGGIELICQPSEATISRRAQAEPEYGRSVWQAFGKMAGQNANTDLRVAKDPYQVQVHTHRFVVVAQLHLAPGAEPESMLQYLPNKFVPVTDATAHFINRNGEPAVIERPLMLVNRDHILLVAVDSTQKAA